MCRAIRKHYQNVGRAGSERDKKYVYLEREFKNNKITTKRNRET